MSARFTWFLVGAGIAAVVAHRLVRRPASPPAVVEPPAPDPRAAELREKLAEARAAEQQQEPEPSGPESVEERRRRVHERGRETTEQMRRPPPVEP